MKDRPKQEPAQSVQTGPRLKPFAPAGWQPNDGDDFMAKMRKLASTAGQHAGLAYSVGASSPANYTNAASLGSLLPKGGLGQLGGQ